MYQAYFKLKENPFTTSPDPRFFYLAPSHAESMAKCEYAIRNKSGLAVVYGDVGTGKTTILNKLRERFGEEKFTVAVLNNHEAGAPGDSIIAADVQDDFTSLSLRDDSFGEWEPLFKFHDEARNLIAQIFPGPLDVDVL